MRIRLMGTREELPNYVDRLKLVFDVREVSDFYPNRGTSTLGRVYVDIALTESTPGTVQATAVRTDREQITQRPSRRIGP